MNSPLGLEQCLTFINCQLQTGARRLPGAPQTYSAITISRQTGAGGHIIAERLAQRLQTREGGSQPWAVIDRNLVEKVIEDHNLPARIGQFMPEDRVSEMNDIMDELFGLHPSSWILARKISETILHLVQLGRVIVLGRGGNIVTGRMPNVFHVRLIGSLPERARRLQADGLSMEQALKKAGEEDRARWRYVNKYFGKDIDDPLLYHLVLNTDLLASEEAARFIAKAASAEPLAAAA
jgi:cytidylate kinase